MATRELSTSEVHRLVGERMAAYCAQHGVRLEIVEAGIHRDDDWWYVPVRYEEGAPESYAWYDGLSDLEDEFAASEGLKIVIVPTA